MLLLCKLLVENIVPKEPKGAIDAYQQAQDKKRALVGKWDIDKADPKPKADRLWHAVTYCTQSLPNESG